MECLHKFLEEPGHLVNHHLESFNWFVKQIPEIIKNRNPLVNLKNKDDKNEFHHICRVWVLTKTSSAFKFGVPVFTENGVQKPLYPNDARLRNMTYSFSIHAKLTFEIEIDGVNYCTNNEDNGFIYQMTSDGDVGEKVGYLKEGEPFFADDEK